MLKFEHAHSSRSDFGPSFAIREASHKGRGAPIVPRRLDSIQEGPRMTLKITYAGTMRGQKLYTVTSGGDRFFTGTLEEVKRYILIHNTKVRERKEAAQTVIAVMRNAS